MILTDEQLVRKYNNGDDSILKDVIDRYTNVLYNFIRRFGFDHDNATDLLQNVFIKVWKGLEKFDEDKSSFKTWIFIIARNTIYDGLRKTKNLKNISRLDSMDDFEKEMNIEDVAADILNILERGKNRDFLLEALNKLSFEEKTIILLHFEEDLTFNEIGQALKVLPNTAKSKYRRALLKMRESLKDLHPNIT